jgi:hypothetical protein
MKPEVSPVWLLIIMAQDVAPPVWPEASGLMPLSQGGFVPTLSMEVR